MRIENMDATIYVIDTETSNTGFADGKPRDGHIVEIGIAQVSLSRMAVKPLFSYIIRDETADRDAWVFHNTSIDYEEVLNAQHERDEISRMLVGRLAGKTVTAYNIDFDRYMIQQDMPDVNEHVRWGQDIMVQASLIPEIPKKHAGCNKYPTAEAAYNHLCPEDPSHLNGHEKHRALADAEMEGYILLELFKRGLWGQEADE